MKIKKYLPVLLIVVLLLYFTGCSDKDSGLSITPEIYEYTPVMSSTPGIGLIASFQRDLKNKNYKFHWIAEQGTFLTWHDNGKGRIEVLGNDIKTNVHKVYWSIDTDKNIEKSSFKVLLKVENVKSSEVMYETDIQIFQEKEGYFSIKK